MSPLQSAPRPCREAGKRGEGALQRRPFCRASLPCQLTTHCEQQPVGRVRRRAVRSRTERLSGGRLGEQLPPKATSCAVQLRAQLMMPDPDECQPARDCTANSLRGHGAAFRARFGTGHSGRVRILAQRGVHCRSCGVCRVPCPILVRVSLGAGSLSPTDSLRARRGGLLVMSLRVVVKGEADGETTCGVVYIVPS